MKFSKKQGAKQKRYETIIDAAEKVLVAKGYEASTFNDFADAANYNKRTLYLYFSDKDDLFAAVVLRILIRLKDHVAPNINQDNSGLVVLLEIATAYFSFFEVNKSYYGLLWSFENKYFIFAENTYSSTNINKTYHMRRKNIDLISEAYEKGLNDGSIKVKEDPNLVIALLWSQTLGVLQLISRGQYILSKKYSVEADILCQNHINYLKNRLIGK